MSLEGYNKQRIALYYFMLGAKMHRPMRAMNYAEKLHQGTRKDGITPSFSHQIWIANYLRTLPLSENLLEQVLTLAFLHDTPEDKGVSFEEISRLFGPDIGDGVKRLTKKFRGVHVEETLYFSLLEEHLPSALTKGVDRLHNISSMQGVFDLAKQKDYIKLTRQWHLPMLKKARKWHPECEGAFENIKQNLLGQISLIEAIHHASL